MADSIRRSLPSLDMLEAWLTDTGVLEIAEELRRLDADERVVAFRLLSRGPGVGCVEALEPAHQQQSPEGFA